MTDDFNNITEQFILSKSLKERYLRPWEPGGEDLVRAGIHSAGVAELVPPYDIRRKNAPFHVIIYTFSGEGRCSTLTAKPGRLFVMPAGRQYYWSDTAWHMIWFHVQYGTYPLLDVLKEPSLLMFSGADRLRELLVGYCDEQDASEPDSIRAMEHYADLILIHLNRNLSERTDPLEIYNRRQLNALWEKVEAKPEYPWKVGELARQFGLSTVQFYRTVVKYEGIPPMAKVQDIRLKQAADHLMHTNIKLEALAEMVGFQSPFSLSRAFKRHYGVSPRHFKQQYITTEEET